MCVCVPLQINELTQSVQTMEARVLALERERRLRADTAAMRQYCDEELLALDQRVGVLIGDADLQAEDNPFTPQAICDAYKKTCRQVDSNVDVRMVLLRLFDDHVLDEMRAVYKAVNGLLIQNSILPIMRASKYFSPLNTLITKGITHQA